MGGEQHCINCGSSNTLFRRTENGLICIYCQGLVDGYTEGPPERSGNCNQVNTQPLDPAFHRYDYEHKGTFNPAEESQRHTWS